MTAVTREQFEIVSDIEVLHVPTGARISTYRYPDPQNAVSSINANWGRAGDRLENGEDYSQEDVKAMACKLLLEQAKAASSSEG